MFTIFRQNRGDRWYGCCTLIIASQMTGERSNQWSLTSAAHVTAGVRGLSSRWSLRNATNRLLSRRPGFPWRHNLNLQVMGTLQFEGVSNTVRSIGISRASRSLSRRNVITVKCKVNPSKGVISLFRQTRSNSTKLAVLIGRKSTQTLIPIGWIFAQRAQ
jgi:hypothetical protein